MKRFCIRASSLCHRGGSNGGVGGHGDRDGQEFTVLIAKLSPWGGDDGLDSSSGCVTSGPHATML